MTSPPIFAETPAEGSECVLLVDDNPANLQVLFQSLDGRGLRLLIAKSGEDALDIARRKAPALILLDIMMPGIDGFEVCRRLKGDPATRDSAIIFLSALGDTQSKVRGLALGAVDYVAKPFQPEEVLARVETHLKIRRLEQALARRNRELETANQRILEALGDGLYGLDAEGRITLVNPAATRMTGWSEAELLGRSLRSVAQPCRADGTPYPDAISHVHRTLSTGDVYRVEDVFRGKSGQSFPVEYTCTPIRQGEERLGAVVVFKDISERKRAERELTEAHEALVVSHEALKQAQQQLIQAAKLESVGRLAAGVAHEVKNPLAIIQLGVDFLGGSLEGDETGQSVLKDMDDAVRRADTVIKGLLHFSREKPPDMQPGDLNRCVEDALSLVRHELTQHDITPVPELADGLPALDLDRDKMHQLFINLFMNAIQAMDNGGVLTVKTRCRSVAEADMEGADDAQMFTSDEEVVFCEVVDTGTGIAESKVDKVFDPFFTTKPVGQGTGLGLSVTQDIIGLHRGTIHIGNREAGGVRVSLKFKARREDGSR